MTDDISNQASSDGRSSDIGKHFFKSADLFFHRPDGIFLVCLLLFTLTVWIFLPALQCNFQYFDESGELHNNVHVSGGVSWQNLRWALFSLEYSNWCPLNWISHMLDYDLFDENAWGHHLTNVLFHAANGVLVFLVLKRMTGALWRSLIVAALFALHPLRVESVAWISERKDVLSAFFGLLTMWMYARFAEESKITGSRPKCFYIYGLSLLFFALALMSKSMLVTLPCLLLLLDFWPLERWRQKSKWSLVMEKVPFFVLVVPVSIAVCIAQNAGGQFLLHFPLVFRLETALMGYARYLLKMFWPSNFSVLYPYPDFWQVRQLLCAAVLIFGISVLVFVLRRQRPYLLVGWLWYLGTLVPVIGLIPLGAQSMSNRYTYMPMIGIALLVVWGVNDLSRLWQKRTVLTAMVVALTTSVCILRTRAEIVYWKNGETLWSRAVGVTKNNFMAHLCLGNVLIQTNPDKALAEFQASVMIYPYYAESQRDLAFLLQNAGHFSEAIVHFEKAIQLDPQNSWALHGLGMALSKMGRVSDAVPSLLKAVEVDPQNASFKDDLSQALFSSEHGTYAISNFLATARPDPTGFDSFLEAVQFDTNRVDLINNLAWAFATNPDPKLRNGKYAIRLATRSCEITGFQTTIMVGTLAAAYAEAGRFDEAVLTGQKACALASEHGESDLLKRNQELLTLYQAHKAYHESIEGSPP